MIVGTIGGLVMSVLSHSFAMIHITGVQRACRDSCPIAAMDPPPSAPCGIPSCARRGASGTTRRSTRRSAANLDDSFPKAKTDVNLGPLLLLADRMHDVDDEEHHEVICR